MAALTCLVSIAAMASHHQTQPVETKQIQGSHSHRRHSQEPESQPQSRKHGRRIREGSEAKTTHSGKHKKRGKDQAEPKPEKKVTRKVQSKPQAQKLPPENPTVQHDKEQLTRAYSLYDAGTNQRLLGNNLQAISQLMEAKQIFHLHSEGAPSEKAGDDDSTEASLNQRPNGPPPMEAMAAFELAQAAEASKNYEVAKHSFQECISLTPKFLPAYLKLSCLEARQGNLAEALKIARQASSLSPNDARPHAIAAHLLENLGSTVEARVEQQRAIDLAQNSRSIHGR